MFCNKKKVKKTVYTIKIQFNDGTGWPRITRDLDEGTTIEQARILAKLVIMQMKEHRKIDIGGEVHGLSDSRIYLTGVEKATVDIIERMEG